MSNWDAEARAVLSTLFEDAEANGGIQYIYTLVRVGGLSLGRPDPLLELRSFLKSQVDWVLVDQDSSVQYCGIGTKIEPLALIANLMNCCRSQPYEVSPFLHLQSGKFPNMTAPAPSQVAKEVSKKAKESNRPELDRLVEEAYVDEGVTAYPLEKCHTFLTILLDLYFEKRLKFRGERRLYKCPRFEVLELLVNDDFGLYGFRMHFSNGSRAEFVRGSNSTDCANVIPETPINFMAGVLDDLKDEWRVGEKRLCEVGLPGRYNKLGHWKPIIYPGNWSPLAEEAKTVSPDDEVRGALFYAMCTGHRCVEFVVRTNIELPSEHMSFGPHFHLFRCPTLNEDINPRNSLIYDGWIELESLDPDYVRTSIATIRIAVNRLAFAFGGFAEWRVKYVMTSGDTACAQPKLEDLHVLDSLLTKFPTTDDAEVLDIALDWYNHGKTSHNILTKFLCYYISLECVTVAVAEGVADLHLEYLKPDKTERLRMQTECIELKRSQIYLEDPARFVKEAYFECVVGLKEKTRRITELVFGAGHPYIDQLFRKSEDGYSLSDLRSELAHGRLALLDKDHVNLVNRRLSQISEIARDFLLRVTFLIKPNDPLPTWSMLHSSKTILTDPRALLAISHEKVLPTKDWRIRDEWID